MSLIKNTHIRHLTLLKIMFFDTIFKNVFADECSQFFLIWPSLKHLTIISSALDTYVKDIHRYPSTSSVSFQHQDAIPDQHSLLVQLHQMQKTAKNNQDEIVILRSALADALRRLKSLEEEMELFKQDGNHGNHGNQRKDSISKKKVSPPSTGGSPTRGSRSLNDRKMKALSSCLESPTRHAVKKPVTRTKSAGRKVFLE